MNTEMETMYESLGISKKVLEFGTQIEEHLKERLRRSTSGQNLTDEGYQSDAGQPGQ